MIRLRTLADIHALRETWKIECKLAQGRDGSGALPEDIWETYSAFANTQGGDILLGLRELGPGHYALAGIPNPGRVVDQLLAGLNDPGVVSVNLLSRDSIDIFTVEGVTLIQISVPRAPIYLRPVYIRGDVLNGSYARDRDADVKLGPERVRQMLARVRGELVRKA